MLGYQVMEFGLYVLHEAL